jgi:hypothetical protein
VILALSAITTRRRVRKYAPLVDIKCEHHPENPRHGYPAGPTNGCQCEIRSPCGQVTGEISEFHPWRRLSGLRKAAFERPGVECSTLLRLYRTMVEAPFFFHVSSGLY